MTKDAPPWKEKPRLVIDTNKDGEYVYTEKSVDELEAYYFSLLAQVQKEEREKLYSFMSMHNIAFFDANDLEKSTFGLGGRIDVGNREVSKDWIERVFVKENSAREDK